MARLLDADNAAAVSATVTRPHWFVRMGFAIDVRLTTYASVPWSSQGGMFSQADLDVRLSESPLIRVFNELASFGATVLTDGSAGRPVSIWQAYVDESASSSLPGFAEPVLVFEGEMGAATIGDFVTISCRRAAPAYAPRAYVAAPVFNHLPKRGTVIEMPQQKITLE
jgi:hypothetical protein